MINAVEAAKATEDVLDKMGTAECPEFKIAIDKLEVKIKNAIAQGRRKISYNVHALGEGWLGKRIYAAIKQYMEELGYVFYYDTVLAPNGQYNYCFTCEW